MCALSAPPVESPNVKLLLFRHGETDWNVVGKNQGHIDIPLNKIGQDQALKLTDLLENEPIEAVISSDLMRATQTVSPLIEAKKIPLIQTQDLREAFLGEAQGLTNAEIKRCYGEQTLLSWRSSAIRDLETRYPGGESGQEVLDRVLACLKTFCSSHSYQCIGVSTHGGVIRRLIQHLSPPERATPLIQNTSIHPIFYSKMAKKFFLS